MTRRPTTLILYGCLSLGLSGCVAAVIPVAAGGLIGRSKLHGHRPATAVASRPPADKRTAAPAASGATTASIPVAPADGAAMQAGTAYAGQLPVPASGGRSVAVLPPAVVPPDRPVAPRWSDVLHYVATASEQRPDKGALPARARTAADRRWTACGDKPSAVIVNLDATTVGGAATYLRSIETLGLAIVYTSRQPSAVALKQADALKKNGVEAPVVGQTLFLMPAIRPDLTARYCVLSIVGMSPKDFPGPIPPGAHSAQRGWFLIAR